MRHRYVKNDDFCASVKSDSAAADESRVGITVVQQRINGLVIPGFRYNLCHGSLEQVRSACSVILRDVYAPALTKPPAEFDGMVAALIDGMKPISPMLDLDAFMTFTYRLCDVPEAVAGRRIATRYSRWMYNVQMYTHDVLLTNAWLARVFRPLLNYNMMFSVWVNVKFPFGAALRFGTKVFTRHDDHQPLRDSPARVDFGYANNALTT